MPTITSPTSPARRGPEYRQNQFGGSFGGAIKKEQDLLFVDTEALRIVQGVPPVDFHADPL